MPSITIRDSVNVEIVSANPDLSKGFGKYLKATSARLLAGDHVTTQLRTPLHLANSGDTGLGLSWVEDIPLGSGGATTLSIGAGTKAVVGVYNRAGMELLESTFIGTPLQVPPDRAFVAFSIRPSLEVGLEHEIGALTFGLAAGSESELRCYRPFELNGSPISTADACKVLLEHFIIPNTAEDVRQMKDLPDGALACVSGQTHLQIGGSVNLAAAFNPLASVNTLPQLGALQAGAAMTASVGVNATVTGEFQLRVQKVDAARVHVSYHKMAGRGVDVTLNAGAGASVGLGDRDVLKMLLGGPGGLSDGAEEDLVAAGITPEQLERVRAALSGALSRKLELAVSAQFSSLKQNDAAFLYEIDLDQLDATGSAALDRGLSGDLTALNALESTPGHGIRVLQSRTQALRQQTVRWRINLVGIVNVLSMTELIREGAVERDEESGDVVITDKVTREHAGAVTNRKQLRKLLYESMLMTLTYKASGLDVNTQFNAAQSFFFFDGDANRQRLSDYLDAVAAIGLIDPAEIDTLLGEEDDFDKASLLLETTFDQAACERAFSRDDAAARATPPDRHFYEQVGRRALARLVKLADPDAYRRLPLVDDGLWKTMTGTGQPGFKSILPPPITGGDRTREAMRVATIAADYSVIVWWAAAMAEAAARVAEMRAFLNGRTVTASLETDSEFRKLRKRLETSMVKAIGRNRSTFDDPWGLVALYLASAGTADARAAVISPKLSLSLPD